MTGSVTIEDGETEVTLSIFVNGDLQTELDESLIVEITGTDNEQVLVIMASAKRINHTGGRI